MGQSNSSSSTESSEILRTEEEEKTFNNEFEFIRVGKDSHFGEYAIMREIKSGRLVCVKEKLFSKRQDMIQFYNSLKAVIVQEPFDFEEANDNINNNPNKIGLQLMNQKENMHNNPNGLQSGAQLMFNNGTKVQKGKINLVSQTVVQKKSKRRNSEILNFCGGDSRIDEADEQVDQRIECIPMAKIPHEGFLRITQVTKSHYGDSFRVLYAVEFPCKTLADQLNSRMNEMECWEFLEQISSVLKIYEGRGQYHGDLSTSSIFVIRDSSQNKVYKIADRQLLGISSHFQRLSKKQEKLAKPICPEQLRELSTGRVESSEWEKSDVFSVGCVLVSLMCGQSNWEQSVFLDGYQFNEQALRSFIQFLIQNNSFSYNLWNLLNSMIATDPKLRPDFNELQRIIKQQKSLPSQPVGPYQLMDASRSQSPLYNQQQQQPQILLSNRTNQHQPQVYQLISNVPRSLSQQGYSNKSSAQVHKTPLINHSQFPNAMSIIHQISPLQTSMENIPQRIEPPGLPWNKRALSIKQSIQGVNQQQYYQNMNLQQYQDQNVLQQQIYQQPPLDVTPGIIVKSSSRDNIHSYQTPVQKKFNQVILNEKSTQRDEIPLTQRYQQQQPPLSSRYVYSNSNYITNNNNLVVIPELNHNTNNINAKDNMLRLVTFKDENESKGKQHSEIVSVKEQNNTINTHPSSIQLLKPMDINNYKTENNNIQTQFTTHDNSKFTYDISTQNSSRTAEIIKNLTGQQRSNQNTEETKPPVSKHIYKGIESGITYTMVKNDNNQIQSRGRVQEDDRSRYSQNCLNKSKDSEIKQQQEIVLQEQQKHLRTASEGAMSKRINSSRNYGESKQDRKITHSPHGLAPSKLGLQQQNENQDDQEQAEESVYDNKQDQDSIYQKTNNLAFYENQQGMSNLKLRNQIILNGNNNSYQQAEEIQGTEREQYQGRLKDSENQLFYRGKGINKQSISKSDLEIVQRNDNSTGFVGKQDKDQKQPRQIGLVEQQNLNSKNDSHHISLYRNPSQSNFKNEQQPGISQVNNGWKIQDKRYASVGKADSASNVNPISSRMAADSYRIAVVSNQSSANDLMDSSILHSRKNLFQKRFPGIEYGQGKAEYDSQKKQQYLQQSSTDGYETGQQQQQQFQQLRQQPSAEILNPPIDEVQALSMFTHSGGSISSRRFQQARKSAAERQKNILREIQDEEFDGVVIQKSSSSCRLSEDDPIPPAVVVAKEHHFVKVQDYLSQRNSKRKEKENEDEEGKVFIGGQQQEETQDNITKERVLERYEDGAYYEGEHLKGLRHGKGKFVYADGAKYEGEWFEGSMTGYGLLYYRNSCLAYEGHWKGDKFHGRGVLYNHSTQLEKSENKASMPESFCFDKLQHNNLRSDIQFKEINYADFSSLGDDWISFDGEFVADEKNGYGTYYFEGNSKFSGNFVADIVDGVGTFTFGNGAPPLIGEWRNNILIQVFSLPTQGGQ